MRNIYFLILMLFCSVTATVNAQVAIGADEAPHPGAILDLKSEGGLLLSKIFLNDVNIFQLSGDPKTAEGMIIYNTNPNINNGQGESMYVWNGSKWISIIEENQKQSGSKTLAISMISNSNSVASGSTIPLKVEVTPADLPDKSYRWFIIANPGTGMIDKNNVFTGDIPGKVRVRAMLTDGSGTFDEKEITVLYAAPVNKITVSAPSSVHVEETINLTANITPSNADPRVTWTIVSGDSATINPNTGALKCLKRGNVTVMATANDGSGVSATYTVTVNNPEGLIKVLNYDVYCYPSPVGCWMVENSKKHEPSAFQTTYTGKKEGERGYYYAPDNLYSNVVCPYGFHIPKDAEWTTLFDYLKKSTTPESQKALWNSGAALAGVYTISGKSATKWDETGYWWTSSQEYVYYSSTDKAFRGPVAEGTEKRSFSVRCVRNN